VSEYRPQSLGVSARASCATVRAMLPIRSEALQYRRAMATQTWTLAELYGELERWERELRTEGKSENTINTYIGRSEMFLRWLAGDYNPR